MTIEGGEEINCLNKSFVHSSQVVNLIVIGHNNFFIGSFSFSLSLSLACILIVVSRRSQVEEMEEYDRLLSTLVEGDEQQDWPRSKSTLGRTHVLTVTTKSFYIRGQRGPIELFIPLF